MFKIGTQWKWRKESFLVVPVKSFIFITMAVKDPLQLIKKSHLNEIKQIIFK